MAKKQKNKSIKIAVVGSGYVGLVSGACFAEIGHTVICVDVDQKKIAMLKKGEVPIYEPGLDVLLKNNFDKKRLSYTTHLAEAVQKSDVIFIAVGTPPRDNGEADLSFVEDVARTIAREMKTYKLVVEKSTVPVQTGERVRQTMAENVRKGITFDVASNPEFLREGTAVHDFMNPDRVVLGCASKKAEELLTGVYKPLNCPILVTDIKSAEIIKHASNSFLATKISFMNAISRICEATGADVEKVRIGMGMDNRIGKPFLNAGIGFGGFCFPKDLSAFIRISEKVGYDFELLKAVERINESQKKFYVKKIEDAVWNVSSKTIGMLGLAFKPNTDDMRFAPSLDIIADLKEKGAKIQAYDPHSMEKAKTMLKGITFAKDAYAAVKGADCIAIVTEWPEFAKLDWKRVKKLVKQPVIIDGRNMFDPQEMKKLGFRYHSIGRLSAV